MSYLFGLGVGLWLFAIYLLYIEESGGKDRRNNH
jgi:hypothetical protein